MAPPPAAPRPTRAGRRRRNPEPPAPTLVLLVRHGRTPTTGKELPGRAPGLHLAPEGVAQAEAVAARIGALEPRPTAIYASPLERTRETAAPIARALGLRVRRAPDLIEVDVGEWTGMPIRRLVRRPAWATVQRWPAAFRFPGGESFTELSTRSLGAVLELVARHPGETVVAVSHADPIKAVVAAAAGVPVDLFQRLSVNPCSVSAVRFTAGGPQILCLNSTATLQELAPS